MKKNHLLYMWRKKYERTSVKNKILISVFLVVMIVVISSASFFFFQFTQVIQQNSQRQFSEFCTQAVLNLNSMFSSVEDNGKYILNSAELLRVFQHLNQDVYTLSQEIDDFFSVSQVSGRYNVNQSVKAVRYYFDTDAIYTREKSAFFSLEKITGAAWYPRMQIAKGAPFWVYDEATDRISCFQAVYRNVQTGAVLGVLEQEVDKEHVLKILNSVSGFSLDKTLLIDNKGMAAYGIGEEDAGQMQHFMAGQSIMETTETYIAEGYIYAACRLENQFILAGQLPKSYMRSQLSAPVFEILCFCGIALGIAALLANLISNSLSGRIQRIIAQVNHVKIESQDYLTVKYDDEITEIELTINQFLQTIRSSIAENSRMEQQKREAEFRVLQEQINPHFLYNCLDSINWMALNRGERKIAEMSQLLGVFFRMSLSRGGSVVPLAKEIEHLNIYIGIMRLRFAHTLRVFYEIPPELKKMPVPKTLLQPLVENAILHGISTQDTSESHIWISAERTNGGVIISVEDDGVGMTEKTMMRVQKNIHAQQQPKSCYGLWNMNKRLILQFGKEAQLQIESREQRGTKVFFSIPE